jgi:hypothetical protein
MYVQQMNEIYKVTRETHQSQLKEKVFVAYKKLE